MNTRIISGILLLLVCFLFSASIIFANEGIPDYTVLVPIPGTTLCDDGQPYTQPTVDANGVTSGGCKTNLNKYLPGAFNFVIGFGAVLAFVMITWGGILYMTTDAIGTKSKGKGYIENALWGLLLILGAWVILNTIDPNLVNFNLLLPKPNTQRVSVETSTTSTLPNGLQVTSDIQPYQALTPEELQVDQNMRTDLAKYNVTVNAGPCTGGSTSGCTNLVGLPDSAYSGVKELAADCGCAIKITGGTEGGHVSHGQGDPVLDIAGNNSTLNSWIKDNARFITDTKLGTQYTVTDGAGNTATYLYESSPPHWHVVYQ